MDWQVNGVLDLQRRRLRRLRWRLGQYAEQSADARPRSGILTVTGNIAARAPSYTTSPRCAPTGVRFGNMEPQRDSRPGGRNLDLSVFRAFTPGSTRRLELGGGSVQPTNTPTFANPGTTSRRPTSCASPRCREAIPERQGRLGPRSVSSPHPPHCPLPQGTGGLWPFVGLRPHSCSVARRDIGRIRMPRRSESLGGLKNM